MLRFERSIDIALATKLTVENSGTLVVVPITPKESGVAAVGLSTRLEKIYGAVYRDSGRGHDRALEAVFNFISEDVEGFRQNAFHLQNTLDPEKTHDTSRSYAAAGISYLLRGLRSHKAKLWLTTEAAAEEQLIHIYKEVMAMDKRTFQEHSKWAYKQSIRNERYWRRQLEGLGSTDLIEELRTAIDESNHEPFEV